MLPLTNTPIQWNKWKWSKNPIYFMLRSWNEYHVPSIPSAHRLLIYSFHIFRMFIFACFLLLTRVWFTGRALCLASHQFTVVILRQHWWRARVGGGERRGKRAPQQQHLLKVSNYTVDTIGNLWQFWRKSRIYECRLQIGQFGQQFPCSSTCIAHASGSEFLDIQKLNGIRSFLP